MQWLARALRRAGYRGEGVYEGSVGGVSIDTRAECGGTLFVALPGAHRDGHEFLAQAIERGAAALLVSHGRAEEARALAGGVPVFDVPDTIAALQELAAAYRETVGSRVVAVTGTNGKTETKELIAAVAAARFSVHATPGNLNNHIGLPLTLLGMEGSEEVLVAEMGANHKNEIKRLAEIARPSIGVVTNIGPGHLEFFGTLKGVAAAKAELVSALPGDGKAVLPADDEFIGFLTERSKAPVVTFGFTPAADYRIAGEERSEEGGYRFSVGSTAATLHLYGRHHLLNAAAAIAVGDALGIPAGEIAPALSSYRPVGGRGVRYLIAGILFVDDSYNANPASLEASLEAFMEIPVTGKRYLVLGDMLELGAGSGELHREAGVRCGKAGVEGLFTLGNETVELNRAAAEQRKAPPHISHFLDAETLAAYLDTFLGEGDAVLVKGSRAMRMETVIDAIERLRGTTRRRID